MFLKLLDLYKLLLKMDMPMNQIDQSILVLKITKKNFNMVN